MDAIHESGATCWESPAGVFRVEFTNNQNLSSLEWQAVLKAVRKASFGRAEELVCERKPMLGSFAYEARDGLYVMCAHVRSTVFAPHVGLSEGAGIGAFLASDVPFQPEGECLGAHMGVLRDNEAPELEGLLPTHWTAQVKDGERSHRAVNLRLTSRGHLHTLCDIAGGSELLTSYGEGVWNADCEPIQWRAVRKLIPSNTHYEVLGVAMCASTEQVRAAANALGSEGDAALDTLGHPLRRRGYHHQHGYPVPNQSYQPIGRFEWEPSPEPSQGPSPEHSSEPSREIPPCPGLLPLYPPCPGLLSFYPLGN
jgi:hypothetical protein